MVKTILTRILDIEDPPETWTVAAEQTFKRCLTLTECKAKYDGETLSIRPTNVDTFKEVIDSRGLVNDQITQRIIRVLREKPGEWIRFTYGSSQTRN